MYSSKDNMCIVYATFFHKMDHNYKLHTTTNYKPHTPGLHTPNILPQVIPLDITMACDVHFIS